MQQDIEGYGSLPDDLVASTKRWQEWLDLERPEDDVFPGDWKRMPEFERLLLFKALRPDRLTAAMRNFVAGTLGREYTVSQPFNLELSIQVGTLPFFVMARMASCQLLLPAAQDAAPGIPVLIFLSPGVDVAADVEAVGRRLGFTAANDRYAVVSLGQVRGLQMRLAVRQCSEGSADYALIVQGQEPIAMAQLARARQEGGWVLLQNIHLTIDWTSGPLEKAVDKLAEGSHPGFRLFLSAEPPPLLERPLPTALLQNSIKLTNEPPEGLKVGAAAIRFGMSTATGC